jgi:hypothetical protein
MFVIVPMLFGAEFIIPFGKILFWSLADCLQQGEKADFYEFLTSFLSFLPSF